jgi:hypothetical protein
VFVRCCRFRRSQPDRQALSLSTSVYNPAVKRFVPIPKGTDGHYDLDRLNLAISHGFCVVRWSPDDAAAREAINR